MTILVALGTPGKLLGSGDSLTETRCRPLSFWGTWSEETIDPCLLPEALGSPNIPRGHKEELPAFLVTLGRAKAAGCAQTPPVVKGLQWAPPDARGQFATH